MLWRICYENGYDSNLCNLNVGLIAVVSAGVWTDPFDGNRLVDGWEFRDYRDEVTEFEVKGGFLQVTNPNGGWGHTTTWGTLKRKNETP